MGVSVIVAAKERQNQGLIADGLANVGERVGEILELSAVVADGEVALRSVAEVGLELDGAVLLVVAEEVLDGIPDGAAVEPGHMTMPRRSWEVEPYI
jgi:hypothetical protein